MGPVVGHSVQRLDGIAKASGKFRYAGDVSLEDALIGKVLRSPMPHALIKSLDVSGALGQPGVKTVLTFRDVGGTNTFGAVIPDQPVLCGDKVRYVGDAVALIAADTEERAEMALQQVRVEYTPLPVISTPEEALQPQAPSIHEKGNIAYRTEYAKGDAASAVQKADLSISEKYHTPRQKHMYIETEAGYSIPTRKGVEVYVSSQAPFKDRMQISRALGLPQDRIRVVATDLGGGFGGKEENTVQIHLALLALKTRKTIKMTWSREESGIAATTRHPMDIEIKTYFRKDGTILANDAKLVADTGAYMSYGPTVLEVATGSLNGPYRIPNTHVQGLSVYTNNPPAGAMRGFGMTQANFAMESQLDIAAEKLGMNPLGLRRINAAGVGETDGTGTVPITNPQFIETLAVIGNLRIWRNRARLRGAGERPWLWRGVGLASGMKSVGYGAFPEQVKVTIQLTKNGYLLYISNPEMGSGTSTAIRQIAAQCLETDVSNVHLSARDTKYDVDSGGSNASRVVYVVGNAIIKASEKLRRRILSQAAKKLRTKPEQLRLTSNAVTHRGGKRIKLAQLASKKPISASAWYSPPRPDRTLPGTVGIPDVLFSYAGCVAQVEVNSLTGEVKVLDLAFVPEVGTVVNPKGLEAQCEGGVAQSIGYALMEDLLVEDGKVKTPNFTTYLVPTMSDVPRPLILPVNAQEPTGPFGAKGAGELPTIAIPAAICNAIHDAVGARLETIPATPERVLMAIAEARNSAIGR